MTAGAQQSTLHLQQKLRACDNYHMSEPLDVAVWDANWNRYDTEIVVSGQYDEVVIDHPGIDQPALIALNPNGRLNQGRMDFMYTIDDTEGIQNLPWVQMRVGCDAMPEGDSALVRVEHHWRRPTKGPLRRTWTSSAPPTLGRRRHLARRHPLDARLQYYGNDADALDYELYGGTEANGFLAWRPDASEPWQECESYEWQPGSLANAPPLPGVGVEKRAIRLCQRGRIRWARVGTCRRARQRLAESRCRPAHCEQQD